MSFRCRANRYRQPRSVAGRVVLVRRSADVAEGGDGFACHSEKGIRREAQCTCLSLLRGSCAKGARHRARASQAVCRASRRRSCRLSARAINSAVTLLYWQVGQRIRRDMLHEQRAEYGEQIVATLSRQLTEEFGRGWTKAAFTRMIQFAERFPDPKIVPTLSQQLTWSHVVELLPLKDSLQRDFYAEMCRLENWSVRTLRAKIDGMLFERTGLSRKPGELAEQELRALRG